MLPIGQWAKFVPIGRFIGRVAAGFVWRYGGGLPAKKQYCCTYDFLTFRRKIYRYAGITRLMDDLNEGLRTPVPSCSAAATRRRSQRWKPTSNSCARRCSIRGKLTEALCNYDGPQGKDALLKALANLLCDELGWEISATEYCTD